MKDANDAHGVGETNIGTPYWQERIFEARRVPGLAAPAVPAHLAGVDVASHQGQPDWRAVAASGVAFAFTKATGGTWYTNPTFARNWLGIRDAGLARGAYHYAFESSGQPLPGDGPEAEADYFARALERAGGVDAGDLLALDIEDGNGLLGEWCLRWLRRVEALTGARPLVYTGAWFSVPHGFGKTPELADYALWLAAYQTAPPSAPAPWREVAIWQHTDRASVPGIAGGVDGNLALVGSDGLAALGKQSPQIISAEKRNQYARPGDVGEGLLAWCAELGTEPAAPSTFLPLGRSPAIIEELVCMDGSVLRWHLPTGKRWRHPAA